MKVPLVEAMEAYDGLMQRQGWQFDPLRLTATRVWGKRTVVVSQDFDETYTMRCFDNGKLFTENRFSHPGPAFDAGYGIGEGRVFPKDVEWSV